MGDEAVFPVDKRKFRYYVNLIPEILPHALIERKNFSNVRGMCSKKDILVFLRTASPRLLPPPTS